jgi:hypothetical protein
MEVAGFSDSLAEVAAGEGVAGAGLDVVLGAT